VELGNAQTITSSAGTVTFNDLDDGAGLGLPAGNGYLIQGIEGAEMPSLRIPMENRQRLDGTNMHRSFRDGKIIRISGLIIATTAINRRILADHLQKVLEPLLSANGTYNFTSHFHTVRYYEPVEITHPSSSGIGASAGPKAFSFALVAGNPTYDT
jgi:hypothetical protein